MFTSPELRRLTFLSLLGLSTAAPVVSATDYRAEAVEACARALSDRQAQYSYELLHTVQRSGYGNYQLWLNGNETGASGFCEVRRGELSRVVEREVPWQRRATPVPAAALLSARD